MRTAQAGRRRLPDAVPVPRVPRRAELAIAVVAMAAAVVTMGGFTLVVNQMDQQTFGAVVLPALGGEGSGLALAEAHTMGRTLAAWFGASLVVLLLLSAAGIALTRSRPHRRGAGWWFLAAGLVCLLGSQLVLFPVAFLFFVAAGLFAVRPVPRVSPR
ncbi:hypothetical protein [Desertihabitans aurantiacus]|uniref:hypothetical protein n=1 Tax=Desertihabitans aurantiacus TaxID=2282477 RepID=UPI000DF7F831|nr:hypothetical protein [Desertihabitans aurantiacus]